MISSLLTIVTVVLTVTVAAAAVAIPVPMAAVLAPRIDADAVPTVDAAETAMDCITATLIEKINLKR